MTAGAEAAGRTEAETRMALGLAARGGLCGRCRLARLVENARGSRFVLCESPETAKYPGQPVLSCPWFERPAGDVGRI